MRGKGLVASLRYAPIPSPRTPIPNKINYTLVFVLNRRCAARSSLATLRSSSYIIDYKPDSTLNLT